MIPTLVVEGKAEVSYCQMPRLLLCILTIQTGLKVCLEKILALFTVGGTALYKTRLPHKFAEVFSTYLFLKHVPLPSAEV